MSTQEKRRLAARTAIIQAATELFGSKGYDATSIDNVAESAGFAKGAVYHHFPNKKAVFEAVFDVVSEDILHRLSVDSAISDSVLKALLDGTRDFFRLCSEPKVTRILLQDGPAVLGLAEWRKADARHFGGYVRAALAAAMEQSEIRKMPLDATSAVALGAIQSAAIDCVSREVFEEAADEYLIVLSALLDGLR